MFLFVLFPGTEPQKRLPMVPLVMFSYSPSDIALNNLQGSKQPFFWSLSMSRKSSYTAKASSGTSFQTLVFESIKIMQKNSKKKPPKKNQAPVKQHNMDLGKMSSAFLVFSVHN